jgi:hypothetical protein
MTRAVLWCSTLFCSTSPPSLRSPPVSAALPNPKPLLPCPTWQAGQTVLHFAASRIGLIDVRSSNYSTSDALGFIDKLLAKGVAIDTRDNKVIPRCVCGLAARVAGRVLPCFHRRPISYRYVRASSCNHNSISPPAHARANTRPRRHARPPPHAPTMREPPLPRRAKRLFILQRCTTKTGWPSTLSGKALTSVLRTMCELYRRPNDAASPLDPFNAPQPHVR